MPDGDRIPDIGASDGDAGIGRVAARLRRLAMEKFYGSVTVKFQAGKPTHVDEQRTRLVRDLPDSEPGA